MWDSVLIIANPLSGKGDGLHYASKLQKLLEETYNATVTISKHTDVNKIKETSRNAYENGYRLVIAIGGDGTLNLVAGALVQNEKRPVFGVLPLGTANDLAKAIGFSGSTEKAIEQYRKVELGKLDVTKVNDTYLVNVLAIGSIPQSVMEVSSEEKNRLGYLAYIKHAIPAVFNYESYPLIIETRNELYEITSPLVLIGSTKCVAGFEELIPEASYDDGLLTLLALRGENFNEHLLGATAGLTATQAQDYMLKIRSDYFVVRSIKEVQTNIDGDKGPNLPIKMQVLEKALDIIIPQ